MVIIIPNRLALALVFALLLSLQSRVFHPPHVLSWVTTPLSPIFPLLGTTHVLPPTFFLTLSHNFPTPFFHHGLPLLVQVYGVVLPIPAPP